MSNLTLDELWKLCAPERRAMLEALMPELANPEDGLAAEAVRVIAAASHTRPESFLRYPAKQQIAFTSKVIDTPALRGTREWAIRAWLLKHHRSLLVSMCDSCKLPHDNGMIEQDAPAPAPEVTRAAAASLVASNEARPVAIYFAFIIAVSMNGFGDLAAALQQANIDPRAILSRPVPVAS